MGEVGTITTGKAFSSNDFNEKGKYLVITNKNISNSSKSKNVLTDCINIDDTEIINKYSLKGDNILVTMDGVNLGKTALYSNNKALLAQRVGRIQSDQLEFVFQVTTKSSFLSAMRTLSVGNAIKHISLKQISEYTSCIPINKDEQQKIGHFFKQLDDTIALHQDAIQRQQVLKKALLQKLFPVNGERIPTVRFATFKEEWEQRMFEEMLDKNDGVRRGPFGSALKKEIFVENSDFVVYEQQNAIYDNYNTRYNIPKEKFDELHKFSLKENDFIMSGAGTIGRISRVPKGIKKGVFNQALIRFRINNELTNPEYFLQFVRAENMQRKLTGANPGSAITNLVPMSEVKKWEVFVPIRAEQQKLGSFFEKIDDSIALHQDAIHKLKLLKQSLLQKMFV